MSPNYIYDADPDDHYDLFSANSFNSEYYSLAEYNKLISNKSFSIVGHNIRTFSNINSLLSCFQSAKMPSIFCLSETRFSADRTEDIDGYLSFHTTRNSITPAGGISLYVELGICALKIDELSFCNNTIEICSIEVSVDNRNIIILGVYRPHSDTIENFNSTFADILSKSYLRNKLCIILGDFNICLLKDSFHIRDFSNLLFSHHFVPCIDKPTHFSPVEGEQPSLIDHIWINKLELFDFGILRIDVSDHLPTFLNINLKTVKRSDKIKIQFRETNDLNKIKFQTMLAQTDWNVIKSDNTDSFAENLLVKLNSLYCTAFPLKTKFISHRHYCNPWMTNSLKELIECKENYFQLYKLSLISVEDNNKFRNKVNKIIRNHKIKYYSDLFSKCKNNLKETWKIVNNILSRNRCPLEIKKITCNNGIYTNNDQIASVFNEFFCNIGIEYDNNIPHTLLDPCQFVDVNQSTSFFLEPVSALEVGCYIRNLKNSKQDIDSISIPILKENYEIISPIFSDLINNCFYFGNFPSILKKAIVLPLFKKGDPNIMSNFRPISILPFLSKIIEKCLKARLLWYFEVNNLFNRTQFGFQKNVSTQDAILHFTEQIYENLNRKLSSLAVYIDFSKCFDTLNREILLRKLKCYGIRGIPLSLFESYLSDRYQAVRVNGIISNFLAIDTGVPQGSVLGPILYLIYVNELPNISELFSTCLFADDTTLLFQSSDKNELVQKCNTGLNDFYNWCCANRLSINISKTNIMLFSNILSPSEVSNVFMNDVRINYVSSFRFLGLIIDDKLKFNVHIDHISVKISKNIGVLYKLRQYLPLDTLVIMYRNMIECYFNYCILIYGNAYKSHLNTIEISQRKSLRVICNLPPFAHTNSIFLNLRIFKFNDIYKYNLGIYMYKNMDKFSPNLINHPYATRSGNYHVPTFQRLTLTQNQSIMYQVPLNWLEIPDHVRDRASLNSFKYSYKSFLISSYIMNE